jgi:oligopeptide/dipeptide ABC transporter ATP-binding protein
VSATARAEPLVRVEDLRTYFYGHRGFLGRWLGRQGAPVRAVDGVSLDIARGEVVGLVGESGSGKTTLGRTILGLAHATEGRVVFDGRDVARLSRSKLRSLRARMQMVFQDPHSSLSPRLRVSYLLTEPYKINKVPVDERYSVAELLDMVELASEHASKYPHELSGGQARRVGIARALALHPDFLIADEPTSGLDVSAAASVLNLMKDLGQRLGLTYLIITHSLNVVGFIADRIAVMYLGQLAEVGPADRIFEAPKHPYTQALLAAVSEPVPQQRRAEHKLLLPGEIPSPKNPPPGCRFHTRCPYAAERCRVEVPVLEEAEPSAAVACHFWREIRAGAGLVATAARPEVATGREGAALPQPPGHAAA